MIVKFTTPESMSSNGTHKLVADTAEEQGGPLGDFGRGRVKRQNEGGVHIGVGADGPRSDLKTTGRVINRMQQDELLIAQHVLLTHCCFHMVRC